MVNTHANVIVKYLVYCWASVVDGRWSKIKQILSQRLMLAWTFYMIQMVRIMTNPSPFT